jgi:IS1 family transposase
LLFPPQTQEAQFDEKWAFVYKKEKHCDPQEVADDRCGDNWDHVAFDSEHKLVVCVIPGKRTKANVLRLVRQFARRTAGRLMRLITSDEYKPYREAILQVYGEPYARQRRGSRGRHPKPGLRAPAGLLYAVVHKHRRKGRVVAVTPRLIYGRAEALAEALDASACSRDVNIAFVERYNGTDRHQNARKVRKSYRFSKDWDVHNAATYFSMYSYNFCWPVRTLRQGGPNGRWGPPRTPAMSAGLTDHVWTLEEWITYPAANRSSS